MPLVHFSDLLAHAYRHRYAVGAFDLVGLEFLEAVLSGAEATRAPVILSLAESHFEHYDFDTLMPAVVAAARRAAVPVAVHLDHGSGPESAARAIRLGANAVMVDASHLPFAENIARTREVVALAHACGVPVEGELGYVAGVEGEDAEKHPGEAIYTSPEEARLFVEQTGVDCLAVSIGTVHGRLRGRPRLDFERLARINSALEIPLVIHGGTGLEDGEFRRLIENGVAKINYYTALSDAAAAAVREAAAQDPKAGYTRLLAGVRRAVEAEVARVNAVFGAAGQTEAALAACRPWREVEHVVLFNPQGLDPEEMDAFVAEGRDRLARVPGVRRVEAGRALASDARYQWAWLVRFAAREVVAAYARHPEHLAYADRRFRPHAPDRLTLDFELGP
jgi:fructose-bisphosphate aldolase class II